ncbi:helix-turn-helix transcriptional regulator [Weissella paramesenteroides]|uniref:helix-turn-helix domain-containing protein n=1 Tax=Weissella paramesenteroides TaxID=1249 RepID=UPI0012383F61|nr:helix-turn-helix transcriptional regulator [Weissella paramesenteroides]KAA8439185.1 helix-turn-helix transcriptional regulator [Weissella paramesenteroides]KAA8440108.1 helix-turn-helix transcriptional regulator [Weissella paramesenteroides]KAA8443982.1 helix-turn-helix transcriptional regulator [Weissella paramesenteroides]KAA8446463.1 helix-turn-helix transcriptional regulator [Weissella paramesenteroides]KAA8451533.1 helix-turn-helix transcriptional regulator [Weissella paramesenteroide
MTHLTNETALALKRKRGELNISVIELANQTGVSRWTLAKILKGKTEDFQNTTISKIDNWLEDL